MDEPIREPVPFVYPDYPSGICVYCGELGDQMDHLLPRHFTGDALRKIVPVVPSCGECNSTLLDAYLPDVEARRELVHRRYRIKYRRRLTMLVRTEDGLAEMGPTLRAHVQRMQAQHEAILRRLAWPHDPNYDADAWASAWEETANVR